MSIPVLNTDSLRNTIMSDIKVNIGRKISVENAVRIGHSLGD